MKGDVHKSPDERRATRTEIIRESLAHLRTTDEALTAVAIAKAIGRPVQLAALAIMSAVPAYLQIVPPPQGQAILYRPAKGLEK